MSVTSIIKDSRILHYLPVNVQFSIDHRFVFDVQIAQIVFEYFVVRGIDFEDEPKLRRVVYFVRLVCGENVVKLAYGLGIIRYRRLSVFVPTFVNDFNGILVAVLLLVCGVFLLNKNEQFFPILSIEKLSLLGVRKNTPFLSAYIMINSHLEEYKEGIYSTSNQKFFFPNALFIKRMYIKLKNIFELVSTSHLTTLI